MMKNILYVILSIFVLQSCSKNNDISVGEKVEIVINSGKVKLSDLVSSTQIVPLESNENCLIGGITKLLYYDNKIFVLDSYVSKGLFVFDKNGKFLYKVGRVGQGPGEFNNPTDFYIDKDKQEIVLLSDSDNLIFYDIAGVYMGKTIDLLKNQGGAFDFVKIKQMYVVRAGSRENDLKILDDKLRVVNSYFPFLNRDIDGGDYFNVLQKVNDDLVLYRRYCSNIIYKIAKSALVPYKEFVFPSGNINYDNLTADSNFKDIEKTHFLIESFVSLTNQGYLAFRKKEDYYISFFNNNSSKAQAFKFSNFENNITFDPYCSVFGADNENNRFIWVSSPERINAAIEEKNISLKENSPLKGVNADDNPVLLFTKMK